MARAVHAPAMNGKGIFNVVITNTAKTLQELITAAGGSSTLLADNDQIKHFDLFPEDGDVMWTDTGTAPTGGGVGVHTGFLAPQQQMLPVRNDAGRMRVMKFIRDSTTTNVNACLWVGE